MMLGKLCQPGVSWDQVLEVLFGLYKGVMNGVELPKCHEHTHLHPHVRVCHPFPTHMSWPFLVRLLVC